MIFSKKSTAQLYKPDPTEDRYNPGLRAFNDVTAEARIQRKNALMFAWGCLVLAGIMGFGMISASHQPRLVPYIIQVDKNGSSVNLGVPQRLSSTSGITTAAIQYQLRQFIQALRSVTFDPQFQQKLMLDYVQPFYLKDSDAGTAVDQYLLKNDPFKIARDRNESVEVAVDEPVPATPTTFELHWFETTRNAQGNVLSKTEWKGFATIELREVTAQQMRLNPLGMYVKHLTIQQVGVPAEDNAQNQ